MWAPFFVVGRFLAAFGASCCVCGRSWPLFFRILGRSGLDLGGPGTHFGGSEPAFFRCFFALERAHCCDAANATKPQFLQCLPPMSVILLILRHVPKHVTKLVHKRVEPSFPRRSCRKLVLEPAGLGLGGVRTSFGWLFGGTWPSPGRPWVPLGLSWALLKHTVGASETILGLSRLVWNGFSLPMASRT